MSSWTPYTRASSCWSRFGPFSSSEWKSSRYIIQNRSVQMFASKFVATTSDRYGHVSTYFWLYGAHTVCSRDKRHNLIFMIKIQSASIKYGTYCTRRFHLLPQLWKLFHGWYYQHTLPLCSSLKFGFRNQGQGKMAPRPGGSSEHD